MSQEGFLTDASTAMLFFRCCRRWHIKDIKDRVALMRELVRRKKAKYMRDVAPFMAGKRVMQVKLKPHNAGPEHFCRECRPTNE